jgi:hypothetical protein
MAVILTVAQRVLPYYLCAHNHTQELGMADLDVAVAAADHLPLHHQQELELNVNDEPAPFAAAAAAVPPPQRAAHEGNALGAGEVNGEAEVDGLEVNADEVQHFEDDEVQEFHHGEDGDAPEDEVCTETVYPYVSVILSV